MAFYGESYPVLSAWPVVGAAGMSSGFAIRNHFDGASDTLTSGDVVMVSILPSPIELDYTDAAVISWVIETGPASSGTLRLTAGADTAWPLPRQDGSGFTEALGDFPVTGQSTIVAGAVAGLTVTNLVDWDTTPELRVEVTSGTVELVQVKLRVWPPTGPAGAWAPAEPWETTGDTVSWNSEPITGETPQVDGFPAAWSLGRALIDNLNGTSVGFLAGAPAMGQRLSLASGPSGQFAQTSERVTYLSATMPTIRFEQPGVDAGFDPREISSEDWGAQIRAVGGGPVLAEFTRWQSGSVARIDGAGQIGMAPIVEPVFTPHPTLAGWSLAAMVIPAPDGVDRVAGDTVALPDAPHLALGVFVPNYFGPVESVSGVTGGVSAVVPIVTVPPHEFFNPALPWVEDKPQRAPRFFVTYSEVDEHPRDVSHVVGIGKPADDLSVFRVPTPLGTLRELRHGEKVSDVSVVYPLKVKLEDGSWTVVAGMTPDA